VPATVDGSSLVCLTEGEYDQVEDALIECGGVMIEMRACRPTVEVRELARWQRWLWLGAGVVLGGMAVGVAWWGWEEVRR